MSQNPQEEVGPIVMPSESPADPEIVPTMDKRERENTDDHGEEGHSPKRAKADGEHLESCEAPADTTVTSPEESNVRDESQGGRVYHGPLYVTQLQPNYRSSCHSCLA